MARKYARHVDRVAWLIETSGTESDECQFWPFGRGANGYGQIHWDGHKESVHIVMLLLTGRPRPGGGLETRHLCGERQCVNPRHLVLGTHVENESDKARDGTGSGGERNGNAKLTAADVAEIRLSTEPQRVLAQRYGVRQPAISRVRTGKRWASLS